LASSDTPIAYSIATGGPLMPQVAVAQGLAYNIGTTVPVTFNPIGLGSAAPGSTLTGTVTITYGTQSSVVVVNISVPVVAAGASLTSISPGSAPIGTTGTFNVYLTGTGFIPSGNSGGLKPTIVGLVKSVSNVNVFVTDTNVVMGPYVNASTMQVAITIPATADANLPFSTGGTITFGVCNPTATQACAGPQGGTVTLNITAGPTIQAVTSASSFVQQNVAPYDLISIFGTGLCGTGCTIATPTQIPVLPTDQIYPTTLSGNVQVAFYAHGAFGTAAPIGYAPILFANNNQINAVVPGNICGAVTEAGAGPLSVSCPAAGVDIVVTVGTSANSNSIPYNVNVEPTDPGIFTVGSDGTGEGAILKPNWSLVSSTNPAAVRSGVSDSDIISIYMTGLGAPSITSATNASQSGSNAPNAGTAGTSLANSDCLPTSVYQSSLNTWLTGLSLTNVSSIDGAVMMSSIVDPTRLAPCLVPGIDGPAVTVGGQTATVEYAGWVEGSVAGLYQVNVLLPASSSLFTDAANDPAAAITTGTPVALPVQVKFGNSAWQKNPGGVNVMVSRQLLVTGPDTNATPAGLTGTAGKPWIAEDFTNNHNAIKAVDSTYTPFTYAVTSGVLPAGLSLAAVDAGNGYITYLTGTPNAYTAGTYPVTVTASDSQGIPLQGSVSFTLTIKAGLFVTTSNGNGSQGNPLLGTTTPGTAVTGQIQATGGTAPYTYSFDSTLNTTVGSIYLSPTTIGAAAPGWLTLGSSSGTLTVGTGTQPGSIAATPVPLVIDVTDANGLTGQITVYVEL
jgi:uncharacterized protein (TIGR03437 family)